MADREAVTFGDFDFYDSDAVLYQDLFGDGHVRTTSFTRVEFPWEGQLSSDLITADNIPTNGSVVHVPCQSQSHTQQDQTGAGYLICNNAGPAPSIGARQPLVQTVPAHSMDHRFNNMVPTAPMGAQQLPKQANPVHSSGGVCSSAGPTTNVDGGYISSHVGPAPPVGTQQLTNHANPINVSNVGYSSAGPTPDLDPRYMHSNINPAPTSGVHQPLKEAHIQILRRSHKAGPTPNVGIQRPPQEVQSPVSGHVYSNVGATPGVGTPVNNNNKLVSAPPVTVQRLPKPVNTSHASSQGYSPALNVGMQQFSKQGSQTATPVSHNISAPHVTAQQPLKQVIQAQTSHTSNVGINQPPNDNQSHVSRHMYNNVGPSPSVGTQQHPVEEGQALAPILVSKNNSSAPVLTEGAHQLPKLADQAQATGVVYINTASIPSLSNQQPRRVENHIQTAHPVSTGSRVSPAPHVGSQRPVSRTQVPDAPYAGQPQFHAANPPPHAGLPRSSLGQSSSYSPLPAGYHMGVHTTYPSAAPQPNVGVQAPHGNVQQSLVSRNEPYESGVHCVNNGSAINMNANHPASATPESSRTYESAQKSDSLKRKKKKQRDPAYYDNFYKNQEIHGKSSEPARVTLDPSAMGDHVQVGPTVGKPIPSIPPVLPSDITKSTALGRSVDMDQPVRPIHSDQTVPLDDRTTKFVQSEVPSAPTTISSSQFDTDRVEPVDTRSSGNNQPISSTPAQLQPSIVPPKSESLIESTPIMTDKPPNPSHDLGQSTLPMNSSDPQLVFDKPSESSEMGKPSPEIDVPMDNSQPEPPRAAEDTASLPTVSEPAQAINPVVAPAPKPSPWGNKPTSWAGLFQKEGQNSTVIHIVDKQPPSNKQQEKVETKPESNDPVTADKDPQIKKLGDYLKKVSINNKAMFIQPRGLINVGNNCYINSILQIIVACPPFYNLFQRLPLAVKRRGPSSTPMLDATITLCKQFDEKPFGNRKIHPGQPFEPVGVYQMLRKVNTTLSIKQGKQEDAEEFLSCLLNGFHEEMIAAMDALDGPKTKANGPQTPNGVASKHEDEEDEWEQVGPKKKATITRVADFTKSPIYNIFGGQMRSALHQHGARESATLQPFFTLQLDIQSPQITNVKEALENFGTKEAVHGFMSNKTKTEVEASKRTSLEELPPVLILHLKQFVYDKAGGCQKLTKKMDYEMDLEISKDLLSPSAKAKIPPGQRTFKLFAVIYHTGKEASGGHYISDYYHVGIGGWIRADDNLIKTIKPGQVLNPPNGFTPYLLVYRRREVPSHNSGSNRT